VLAFVFVYALWNASDTGGASPRTGIGHEPVRLAAGKMTKWDLCIGSKGRAQRPANTP
jgi:hypothetical protein